MEWHEAEVSQLEKKIKEGKITKGANLFYGSSSFRLWDTMQNDLAPYHIENVAFGGSTLKACVYFFERIILPCEPKSLIIYAGENDIGDGVYHADLMVHFEKLLKKRADHLSGIHFTFISIKPSPAHHALLHRIRLFNSYAKSRIEELDNMHYIDLHSQMYTADGMPNPELFSEDGLHINTLGYKIWRENLLQNADKIFVERVS